MSDTEAVAMDAGAIDSNKVDATIIRKDDGYPLEDDDGPERPVCKLVDEGDRTIALTRNASNRKWYSRKAADAAIDATGSCPLYYKASRTLGSSSNHLPNEKLIAYLSEEEQAEYKAIIDRAIAARDADRKKPLTEREKIMAKIAQYERQLAKLDSDNTDNMADEKEVN